MSRAPAVHVDYTCPTNADYPQNLRSICRSFKDILHYKSKLQCHMKMKENASSLRVPDFNEIEKKENSDLHSFTHILSMYHTYNIHCDGVDDVCHDSIMWLENCRSSSPHKKLQF